MVQTTPSVAGTGNGTRASTNHDRHVGGTSLLVTDARVAYLLVNDARQRTIARLFGTPRDTSSLLTIVAIGTIAGALYDKATAVLKVGRSPSAGDALIGGSVVNVALHGIAGSPEKETRFFGILIGAAVLAGSFGPVVGGSIRRAKAWSHSVHVALGRRYGG